MLAVGLAVAVAFDVSIHAVWSYPTFEATFETCAMLAALAGACAFAASFRQTRRLRDLLLGSGLLILVVVDLVSFDGPTMLELRSRTAVAGAPIIASLFAAGCFLAAARTAPELRLAPQRRWGTIGIGAAVLASVAIEFASWPVHGELVSLAATPTPSAISLPPGHPLAMLLLVAGVLTSMLAAVGFLAGEGGVDCGRDNDEAWAAALFAGGVMLIEVGTECLRWYELPAPGRTPASVAPAAGVWLAALCFMWIGVHRQLAARRRVTAAALAERDRQRFARDLHDGICQDLAFIAANCSGSPTAEGDENPIAVAALRALAAARGTLAELSASDAPDVSQALQQVASELAKRFGITVAVQAQTVRRPAGDREAIVRTVREAVVNAATHGNAQNVFVSLRRAHGRLILRVQDDGCGAQPDGLSGDGFGMTAMRQHAIELGGSLQVHPRDGGGTELEVVMS